MAQGKKVTGLRLHSELLAEDEDVSGPRSLLPLTVPLRPLNVHSSGDLYSTTTTAIITTDPTFHKVTPFPTNPVRQASLCLLSVHVPSLHKRSLPSPKVCVHAVP